MTLRQRIPSLANSNSSSSDEDVCEDGDSKSPAMKVNKGVILEKAIDYIVELERQREVQAKEIESLRSMTNERLQRFVRTNGIRRKEMGRGY